MSNDALADLVGHAQAIITIANDAAEAAGTIQERTPRLNPTDRHNIIATLVDTIDNLHRDHHDPRNTPARRLSTHQRATALAATLATFTNHTERRPSLLPATWNDCANDPRCTYLADARKRANHDAYVQCLINADTLATRRPTSEPITWTIEPADPAGQWPAALVGTTATQHLGHYLEHTALARNGWHYIARRAADIERQLQEQ